MCKCHSTSSCFRCPHNYTCIHCMHICQGLPGLCPGHSWSDCSELCQPSVPGCLESDYGREAARDLQQTVLFGKCIPQLQRLIKGLSSWCEHRQPVSITGPRVSLSPSCGVLLSEVNGLEKSNYFPQGSGQFSQGMHRKVWKKCAGVARRCWLLFMGDFVTKNPRVPCLSWDSGCRLRHKNVGTCKQAYNLENSSVHFVLVIQMFFQLPTHRYLLPFELAYGVWEEFWKSTGFLQVLWHI